MYRSTTGPSSRIAPYGATICAALAAALLLIPTLPAHSETTGPAIASGETRFGRILHAGYGDRFRIEAPADSVLCFYVAAYRSELDPKILFTDDEGRVLVADDDGGIGSSAYLITRMSEGERYLNVAGESATKGQYRLKMWSRAALELEEFPAHFSGTLRRAHEVHLYQFEASGEEFTIRVRGTEGLRPHVQLIGPGGHLARSVWADSEQRIILKRHLFTDPDTGNTHVLVIRAWDDSTGPYTLDIAKD